MTDSAQEAPVLLITGASRGVGAAAARAAVAVGYSVALIARGAERLELLADELGRERALPIVCDVRNWEEQESAVAQTLERFGHLDAAYVNAAVIGGANFLDDTPERWHELLQVNLLGAALTIRACLPALEASGGDLAICGSTAGRILEYPTMYSAAKWGLTALGHGLRQKLAPRGIRVMLIEPGLIETDFNDSLGITVGEIMEEEGIEKALQPEDVANALIYALEQPRHVSVNEILLRPRTQIP
jgi:NADP-dependent 3-hydroxy acid dehydrogenase YdfG